MLLQDESEDENSSGSCNSRTPVIIIGSLITFFLILAQILSQRKVATATYKLKKEVKKCTTIDSSSQNFQNQHNLVHLTGVAETQNLLKDDEFGLVLENSIRLERRVEIFQEVRSSLGPGTRNEVSQTWWPLPKGNFKWLVQGKTWINPDVKLGVYKLSYSLKRNAQSQNCMPLSEQQIQAAYQNLSLATHENLSIKEQYLYLAQNSGKETLGDYRVCFPYVSCGPKTIISQLTGSTFIPWIVNKRGYKMSDQELAIRERMIERDYTDPAIEQDYLTDKTTYEISNNSQTSKDIVIVDWLIEGIHSTDKCVEIILGDTKRKINCALLAIFIMQFILLLFLFHPLPSESQCMPFLDNFLKEASIFLILAVDLLLALALCLAAISLAWVCYTPIKGFSLIAVSAGILIAVYFILAGKN